MITFYAGAVRSCADDIFCLKKFLSDGEVARSYLRVFAGRNEIIQMSDTKCYFDPSNFHRVKLVLDSHPLISYVYILMLYFH